MVGSAHYAEWELFQDIASDVGSGIMASKCTPCQQYRKDMGAAMSQASFIKAAKIAMEAAAHAVTGKQKGDKKDATTE